MKLRILGLLSIALATALAAPARADITVSYSTVGTFTGGDLPGTSTYLDAANGISITFLGRPGDSVGVPPASQTSFGTFDSTGTTATTSQTVSSGFTLDIFQTGPTPGFLEFVGQLQGTLRINNSGAFVQFTGPLSGNIGIVSYAIASADNNTPGRVNIAPTTTNNGQTTVVGIINTSVPEPSSVVMAGLAGVALLGYRTWRRRGA